MFTFAAPLFEQNKVYAEKLVADLSEAQMTAQPVEGRSLNHAAFVIGHLAWVADVGATVLGFPAEVDPAWSDLFSRTASPKPGGYPAKAVMVEAFKKAHDRLVTIAQTSSKATLDALPPERFRSRFPTVGHVVLHMLTNHSAVHLGQLSAWRRALGLPSV